MYGESNVHVTGRRECEVEDGLGGHPLEWKLSTSVGHVNLVIVDVAGQPEVTDLDRLFVSYQDVPGGQVTMDEPLLR